MAKEGTTQATAGAGGNGTGRRTESETIAGFHFLRREAIEPDPTQPRKTFDEATLKELAANLAEVGIIQPLVVRFVPQRFTLHEPDLTNKKWTVLNEAGQLVCEDTEKECRSYARDEGGEKWDQPRYVLVAGERRLRAATLADQNPLPCLVRVDMEAREIARVQYAENHGREALPALDEGESFHELVHARKLFTAAELAKELGMSAQHVYGRMKLATVPKAVKDAVRKGELNPALAELVAKVPGEKNQLAAMKKILTGGNSEDDDAAEEYVERPMSVREAKRFVRKNYMLDLEDAPFDLKEQVTGKFGPIQACADCPKRSGNCPTLFPELEKTPNVCTDPECYESKRAAKTEKLLAGSREKGLTVLTDKQGQKFFGYGDQFDPYHQSSADLNDKVAGDKQGRTYKQLLGKDLPAKTAVVSPKGQVVEFYQRELLNAALEQKGFAFAKAAEREQKETPEELARAEKVLAARTKLGGELMLKVGAQLAAGDVTNLLRWMLACLLYERFYQLGDATHPILKKVFATKERSAGLKQAITGIVAKLKPPETRSALVALVLGFDEDSQGEGSGLAYDNDWTVTFALGCEFAGVDLKKEEALVVKWAEHDADVDAKADAKVKDLPGAKFEKAAAKHQKKKK